MKTRIDADNIRRLAQGDVTDAERVELKRAIADSPELAAELRLWQAVPDAAKAPEPVGIDWERMEDAALRGLEEGRQIQRGLRLVFKPALVVALAVLIAATVWLFESAENVPRPDTDAPKIATDGGAAEKTNNNSVTLPPRLQFDTGAFVATTTARKFALLAQNGEATVAVRSLQRGRVQGGDRLLTGPDQTIIFRLDERVLAVLDINSEIEFRNYNGNVAPYLVKGRLACRIEQPGPEPFVVLARYARVIDVGTAFSLRSDAIGRGALGVSEGRVRLERPGHKPQELAAGQRTNWDGPIVKITPNEGLSSEDPEPLFASAAVMQQDDQPVDDFGNRPEPGDADSSEIAGVTPMPTPQIKKPKTRSSEKPAPNTPDPAAVESKPTVTYGQQGAELTSWQQTLESMPRMVRDRITSFYATVEQQMRDGYTLRAIANLENFIETQPGPASEKARFLLGEAHYSLQHYDKAQAAFMAYIEAYPYGTWVEMARFRFVELKNRK